MLSSRFGTNEHLIFNVTVDRLSGSLKIDSISFSLSTAFPSFSVNVVIQEKHVGNRFKLYLACHYKMNPRIVLI